MTNTVWEEVERNETHVKCRARNYEDTGWVLCVTKISWDHPTHMVTPGHPHNEVELGVRGFRWRKVGDNHWQNSGEGDAPFVPRSSSVGSTVPKAQAAFKSGDRVRVIQLRQPSDLLKLNQELTVSASWEFRDTDRGEVGVRLVTQCGSEIWAYPWQLARVGDVPVWNPEVVSPTEDRYAAARKALALKIDSEDPELDVGYETQRKPGQKEARERNIAALRADLDSSTSARRRALQKRFGARLGIDDVGGGSGPGWED